MIKVMPKSEFDTVPSNICN